MYTDSTLKQQTHTHTHTHIALSHRPAYFGWLRGTVVERRSLAGGLSLSCA